MKDLALLVADKNMDYALRGILSRHESIGVQKLDYEIGQHMGRDGGVRTTGPETLSLLRDQFRDGILMLDWEGSGSDSDNALILEQELDRRLTPFWGKRAKAIVIEPELDAWVWGSDNVMQDVIGWCEDLGIRKWLANRGYEFHQNQKPVLPKEALQTLMEQLRRPRSSALYEKVTAKISLRNCNDPSFNRLKTTLQKWFSSM